MERVMVKSRRRPGGGVGAVLVAWTCLTVAMAVPAGAATGGIGGRPANPDPNNPRTESIFIYTLDKGASKQDQVLVSNGSSETKTVELYPVDGVVTNTGAYTCKQRAEARSAIGEWLTLDRTIVTLDPGATTRVDFVLNMPANADVGEHNGCIVFETKDDEGQANGSIRVKTRQAVRVVATVPGQLHREITMTSFNIRRDTNAANRQLRHYDIGLKNVGKVSADTSVRVQLTTLFGKELYRNGGQYPVLADQKLELSFDDTTRPFFGGWYKVTAQITYNKTAGSFGLSKNEQDLVVVNADPQVIFIAPSVGGIVVIAATVGGLVAAYVYRRVHKSRKAARYRDWRSYDVQPGDTIESIAAKHHVSWRQLADANALKAPYSLSGHKTLRVPPLKRTKL